MALNEEALQALKSELLKELTQEAPNKIQLAERLAEIRSADIGDVLEELIEEDDELDADLDVVQLVRHSPRSGEGEARDGGDGEAPVHQPCHVPTATDGLDRPCAEEQGEPDEMDEHDEVAKELHATQPTAPDARPPARTT